MPQPKDYDTTIARIAGNVLAGLVTVPAFQDRTGAILESAIDTAVWMARAIVAEVKRTEDRARRAEDRARQAERPEA